MNASLSALARNASAAAAALLLGLPATPALAQATLGFAPSTAVMALGDTIDLDIVFSERPAATPVGFFDIDVVFDPTVLSFTGISFSDALGNIALGEAVNASLPPDPAGGVINLAVLSLLPTLPAQSVSPVLGQISFSAIGLGSAGVGFGFAAIESLQGDAFAFSAVDAAVSVVPEPAAFWLLGAGVLALLAGTSRRRG